jgi:hypothetical protein
MSEESYTEPTLEEVGDTSTLIEFNASFGDKFDKLVATASPASQNEVVDEKLKLEAGNLLEEINAFVGQQEYHTNYPKFMARLVSVRTTLQHIKNGVRIDQDGNRALVEVEYKPE